MPRNIMVIAAHPDDVELTCAGSIARWVYEGSEAVLVVATDGALGGKLAGSVAETVSAERRQEQGQAARLIGFRDVVYLGFADGELVDDEALRGALVREVRRTRPDAVVVMDPTTVIFRNEYVNHRDHRMLGMATLDALYPEASNAGYFPDQLVEGLQLHKVPELLLSTSEAPNHWVDISSTVDLRFEALRMHASQIRLWPEHGEAVIRQQRAAAAAIGARIGVAYAEEYRRILVNALT